MRGRGKRGGRSWDGVQRPQCQLCGANGHVVWQCYHRFNPNFQNPQKIVANFTPPPFTSLHNPQAQLATPSTLTDSARYLDSSASHHLTFDARNMLTSSEFDGFDHVHISNGIAMAIEHIGNTTLHSKSSNTLFKLNNLMHVPHITKNLISVSKFPLDNDVYFEFSPDKCDVKSQVTKTVLLQGKPREGIYMFDNIQVS